MRIVPHCARMHDFIPGDESGYDECGTCGLLAETEVVTHITIPCGWRPCTAPANHDAPCVVVSGDSGDAVCSYCERVCGSVTGEVDDDGPADEDDDADADDELAPLPLY